MLIAKSRLFWFKHILSTRKQTFHCCTGKYGSVVFNKQLSCRGVKEQRSNCFALGFLLVFEKIVYLLVVASPLTLRRKIRHRKMHSGSLCCEQGRRNRPPNPPVGGRPRPGQGPRPLNTNQRPIFKFRR